MNTLPQEHAFILMSSATRKRCSLVDHSLRRFRQRCLQHFGLFNNSYSSEWFSDPLAQRIIKSVDNGIALGPNAIQTKVLGIIPPEKLSSGTKTLLLMLFQPNVVFNTSNCGDNCAYWILRIASKRDVTINLYHLMDFGNGKFTARISNTGDIVHSMNELVPIALNCLRESN